MISDGVEEQAAGAVEAFLEAYNVKDFETIERLVSDEIHMVHYGRDVDVRGRDSVLGMLARSAEGAFPDRHFNPRRRRLVDGEHVVIEHAWEGTATVDVPGFATAGEAVSMELCTIFTIRQGQIVEYTEYG